MILAHDPENNIVLQDFKKENNAFKESNQKRFVIKIPCLVTYSESYAKNLEVKTEKESLDIIKS